MNTGTPVAASQNQLTSRIRVRPPNKFAQESDILLWLQRFELYVARATIPRTEWATEVLSLLEDGVVSHLGLTDSDDYEAVRKCLQQRYAPEGNELDWQLRLQSRTQKVGEPLEDYVGKLRVLVEKAYPNWTSEQQEVLVQHLTETVAQLQLSMLKGKEGTMSSKKSPVCWRFGKEGHLKRDCQQRKVADRPTGQGRGLKSFAVTGKGTPAVTVEGKVDGYPVQMLVDTGSMVTLLREDFWREITSISGKELKQPVRSEVVANDEVCTVNSSHEAPICHNRETEVGHRNHVLQQLEQGAEGLSQEEKMALRSLLNSYVDVLLWWMGQNLLSSREGDGHSTKEKRCGHFRAYLYGRSFESRTDHQSLKWLRSFKEPEGQMARWNEALAEYDFEVVHRPAIPRGRSAKFHRPWKGPYIIVKALNDVVYRIRNVDAPRKKLVVHFNRLKPYKHDCDQNGEARSEDSGPVQKSRKVPKPSGVVSPEEPDESEDEELKYPLMHLHQPDPGQDLNNPVAQPFLVPDNVPVLPGDIGIAENAHQRTPLLRQSTRNRKPPDRY
eukprot:Em0007g117a